MLTEKENWKLMHSGEMPEFLPRYDMFGWNVICSFLMDHMKQGGTDVFGVEFVSTKETGGALPAPGKFILKDIRQWRDVIKAPDISGIDWEALAKKDLKERDTQNNPVIIVCGAGVFQQLMSFMGFTEGLCAMCEEPDEVYELFDYLTRFSLEIEKNMIKYYKPDGFVIGDDNATALNPFISPKMYRELIKPFHKSQLDLARENGLYLQMHDCGRCEDFIDDWIEMGITAWDPAQVMNDLTGIKRKYGRKLILSGCWDYSGVVSWLNTDDLTLKDALAEYVDTFAPNGGFAFMANVMGAQDNEDYKRKTKLINDFYLDYARDWYKTH